MHSSDARKSKQLARAIKPDVDAMLLHVSTILSTVLGPHVPVEEIKGRFTRIEECLQHIEQAIQEQLPAIGEGEITHE